MIPHAHGLLARVGYFRLYTPLAGRYLDFGNPNSLGGNQYQWNDLNGDGLFEPGEQGMLLLRFGGPYSSISTSLRRPYADELNVGFEISGEHWGRASVLIYRRYDNNRLAAIDAGLPPGAFTPVTINDPAPTYGPGPLEVFAQNPATFGLDHYLLTNPPGLRVLTDGILIELSTAWRGITFHASGSTEESFGPTNPGNSVFENDPGVVGDLLMDPNTTVFASGRSFMDRAYTGKGQATYRLPASWGRIELAGTYDYIDGLPFGGELLVTGLPQGPFLVQSTERGTSKQSGYRADNVKTLNLRLRRDFRLPTGKLSGNLDILNVLDSYASLAESDVTNSTFILRLPLAVQPPRNLRIGLRYEF